MPIVYIHGPDPDLASSLAGSHGFDVSVDEAVQVVLADLVELSDEGTISEVGVGGHIQQP